MSHVRFAAMNGDQNVFESNTLCPVLSALFLEIQTVINKKTTEKKPKYTICHCKVNLIIFGLKLVKTDL